MSRLKRIAPFVISLQLMLNGLAQRSPTVVFNFDSTKVFVKYADLEPVLKKRNRDFRQASIKALKNDTCLLYTSRCV